MTSDQAHKLTAKQDKFVIQYVALGNATEAAISAGYSPNTARFIASENLTKPNIQLAIQQRKAQLAQSGKQVTPEWVISKLAERASDDSSPASSVSALRTLADILGMTAGNRQQAPAGYAELMEALGRGLMSGQQPRALDSRTVEILPPASPADSEQDGPG